MEIKIMTSKIQNIKTNINIAFFTKIFNLFDLPHFMINLS